MDLRLIIRSQSELGQAAQRAAVRRAQRHAAEPR
jgi:hypothetical protein